MTLTIIYLLACAVLFIGGIYMILCPHYDDGVIGKLSLIAVVIPTFAALYKGIDGLPEPVTVSNEAVAVLSGMAIFVWRHLRRFWRFNSMSGCKSE